jgi:tight adherence protein B
MSGSFLVAVVASIATYLLISTGLDRRAAAAAVRRLAVRPAQHVEARRASKPLLIESGGEVRGRMAAGLLKRLRLKEAAERLLETAALRWGAAGLLHRSIAMFLAGFAAASIPTRNAVPGLALGVGALFAAMPLWYVRRKARLRVAAFEEQFPDCLEFISRSMRAGHAFSVALEMVLHEYSDPLAAEFRRAFEEQNLGQALEVVLRKLSQRVPSMDVQFFVSAVLLQKRTGGNLAELLDKLAQLIRERFKLRARIRAVSAQGLMSGRILSAIPAGVGVMMFLANPGYARFFVDDPAGHELIGAALGLQFVGYLIIRKIVTIEV